MTERAAPAGFTYTKLLKRLAPAAVAVAACLSLLLLGSWTNQHEWAVGWLRRRFEGLDPLPFTFWAGLERGGVLIALSVPAALIQFIRQSKSPTEQEKEETCSLKMPKQLQRFMSSFSSFFAVNSPLIYALQIAVLVPLKLFGAGAGTLTAASVFVCAAFVYKKKYKKKDGSRWLRTLQGAAGGVYTGFAFAHWAASSWWTGLWTPAALYAASVLMIACFFSLPLSVHRLWRLFNMALTHWQWVAAVAVATALWLWFGGSLDWTVGWIERRYDGLDPWTFCWRIAAEHTVVVIVLFLLIAPFESSMVKVKRLPDSKEENDSDTDTALNISVRFDKIAIFDFTAVFVAPVAETLAFQDLIIPPLSALGADIGTQVVVSGLLFFLAHCAYSSAGQILASAPGGIYLGFAFAHWRPRFLWTALWVTALAHALFNLAAPIWTMPAGFVVGLIKARREMRKMSAENNGEAETDEA